MATTAEKRAYAKKLLEISRRFEQMEDDTVKAMVSFMLDAQKAINGRVAYELTAGNTPTAAALADIAKDIGGITDSLNGQLLRVNNISMNRASIDGQEFVIEPLTAGGVDTFTLNVRPSIAQINILTDFSADLITRATDDMKRRIVSEIRLAALSGRSPMDAMRNITQIIGINGRKQIVGGVTAQAERIYRTELNRAFNIANYTQQQDTAARIPDVQKQWMATADKRTRQSHLIAHGQTVDVDEKFTVGGAEMDYPLDPSAPAKETINCRCRSVTIHPDIGAIETALDRRIAKEKERRAN